jgi:hypothetical protein
VKRLYQRGVPRSVASTDIQMLRGTPMLANNAVNKLIEAVQLHTYRRQGFERQHGNDDEVYKCRSVLWTSSDKTDMLEFGDSTL